MAEKKKNFEQSMEELEEIIAKLEEGGLPLDESMKAFETGVKLASSCQTMLDQAQQKVSVLLCGEDGQPILQPMDGVEETDA